MNSCAGRPAATGTVMKRIAPLLLLALLAAGCGHKTGAKNLAQTTSTGSEATAVQILQLEAAPGDFLLGERFAKASGATLLPDAVVHDLHGTRTLIMHGDQLCTDDVGYQRFRAWWQDPVHRRRFLALPFFIRRGIGAALSAGSRRAIENKPEAIMDVNADAVASALRERGVSRLIHGHTHRPAHHAHDIDGRVCERQVLADWYRKASYLEVSEKGMTARG